MELRRQGSELVSRGFQLDDAIDLRADAGLGSSYEGSTAAYKLYESGQIPSDEELHADLEAILVAYDRYLEARPAATPTEQTAWIFQANPEIYDVTGAIKALHELLWVVRQHRSRIQVGDRVYLWQAGPDAGIVAIATIAEGPANLPEIEGEEPFRRDKEALGESAEQQVRLRIDRVLPSRLRKDSLRAHPTLGSLTILRAPVGTNFAVTPEQALALDLLLAGPVAEEEQTRVMLSLYLTRSGHGASYTSPGRWPLTSPRCVRSPSSSWLALRVLESQSCRTWSLKPRVECPS